MDEDKCEMHEKEMRIITQIALDIGNVKTDMGDVKTIVKEMNGRVRDTEKTVVGHDVSIKNQGKSIDWIRKIIWTTVVAVIASLYSAVSKLLGFAGK